MKVDSMRISFTAPKFHLFCVLVSCFQYFASDTRLSDFKDGSTINHSSISKASMVFTTSNTEEFLNKYLPDFLNVRKQFVTALSSISYDSASVLKLLAQCFPIYTFFENDMHQFVGYGPQSLVLDGALYNIRIVYYRVNLEKPVNAINLSIVNADNSEMVCQTINYTGDIDYEFLHMKDPDSTIKVFTEILSQERRRKIPIKGNQESKASIRQKRCWFCCFSSSVVPFND